MKKVMLSVIFLVISLLSYSQTYPNDVGVIQLVSPVSGYCGPVESIMVVVKNFGTLPQNNIPIYFTVDASIPVAEVIPNTISPGSQITYMFAFTADLSIKGCHHVTACTGLPGDQNPSNDWISLLVMSTMPTTTGTSNPLNLNHWTGSTDGSTLTQNCDMKITGDQREVGWTQFDVSAIPDGSNIVSAILTLHTMLPYQDAFFKLKKMTVDPLLASPSTIYNDIIYNQTYASSYQYTSSGLTLNFPLPVNACNDLMNMLFADRFSIGIEEMTVDTTHLGSFYGWGQGSNTPSLTIKYSQPFPHDLGIVTIEIDTLIMQPGNNNLRVLVRNFGSNPESSAIVLHTNDGFTDTADITQLCIGCTSLVTFDPWWVTPAYHCVDVELLPGDPNCTNNQLSRCFTLPTPSVTIEGTVLYENAASDFFTDSVVVILFSASPPGPAVTDTIDSLGMYHFTNLVPGIYELEAQTIQHWRGVNATDASLVLQHIVGVNPLNGIKLAAADVNADNGVTSLDALMIIERCVGMINGFFPSGVDWVFEKPMIITPSYGVTIVNIKGLCSGDVNGSGTP